MSLVGYAVIRWAAPAVATHLPAGGPFNLRAYGVLGAVRHRWYVTVWSVLAGAATHLVWDGFTHAPDNVSVWAVRLFPALAATGPLVLPWFRWIQYSSSFLGALAVIGSAWWLGRSAALTRWHGEPRAETASPRLFWGATSAAAAMCLGVVDLLPYRASAHVTGIRLLYACALALIAATVMVRLHRRLRSATCVDSTAAASRRVGQDRGVDDYRIERDTMGEVRVPASALWRAQTQRAVENFPVSGRGLEPAQVRALARIKAAAAAINAELGVIDAELAAAIEAAAREVADGRYDAQFPVDTFQTGSGTSSNMNANEVIATLASARLSGRAVHPNDHVNASQSSNDVFPSSIHLAATEAVSHDLLPALAHLMSTLDAKGTQFDGIVKAGRTHLMDATPVTLGQEFHGYGTQIRFAIERLQSSLPRLAELPLGGTAVGTGVNMPAGFAARVIERLRHETGLPLSEARDHFEAQGARDALVETSGQLRTVAVSLYKVANDIRWMGSGPRAGLRELRIPDLQPGSSIMPGKVNPVVCESVRQVCAQVIGNDAAVAFAGSQGDFELNVMLPVMARNLLESIRLLAAVSMLFADRCVAGLAANVDVLREYAEGSPAIVTPLNRHLGYDEAAAIAKQALAEGKAIRAVVRERGHIEAGRITQAQLDEALDVLRMTRP